MFMKLKTITLLPLYIVIGLSILYQLLICMKLSMIVNMGLGV